ncbi:ATP-binding protein [Marinicauda pacifica]|uniref:ATP-binding protein n=1 Tax=Marinicauda pacifica TaxID=1133559 RepID=UPI0035C803FA
MNEENRVFEFESSNPVGQVTAVDTGSVKVKVHESNDLNRIQVNRLVALESPRPAQTLIGIVTKITREGSIEFADEDSIDSTIERFEENTFKANLIGTLFDRVREERNIFRRSVDTVPSIGASALPVADDNLTRFMQVISKTDSGGAQLRIGNYSLDDNAAALLNGNKLFQRHSMIVGSTGSGKSYTVASIIEQAAKLDNPNIILFDIHGEYKSLSGAAFRHLRIASSTDIENGKSIDDGVLHLPAWLMNYEALRALLVDRSDENAPNQAMLVARTVYESKKNYLDDKKSKISDIFTVDSPIPFDPSSVLVELERLNTERVPDARGKEDGKAGDFNGKLSRLIARLSNKLLDKRLGFLFGGFEITSKPDWIERFLKVLMAGRLSQSDSSGGIKIIDLSEVPSDILPFVAATLARVVFTISQWTKAEDRHPIAILCDEAHLYVPSSVKIDSGSEVSVAQFERIAKEGRKYGVGLCIISQRPSEVNRTVLSQCNNIIAMRLTNSDDQNVIRHLLPENLGGFGALLPTLDVGEALVVGDATLLPVRVRITPPENPPLSATVPFWDEWAASRAKEAVTKSLENWQRQSYVRSD